MPFFCKAILARALLLGPALFFLSGCGSVKKAAMNKLADVLAEGGNSYSSDEDPLLVRDAVPFSLKLMESTLEQNPKHQGLLRASCSGFTQYAFAFLVQEADEREAENLQASEQLRTRAKKLYLRGRGYGLRGLDAAHPGLAQELARNPKLALSGTTKEDVPLLYWTAAAWGGALSLGKNDPGLIAEIPQMEALIDRALELDEAWGNGSLHAFLINYEMSRQGLSGDPALRAKRHFDRAVELSKGLLAGPYVSYAEAVCVEKRDVAGFERMLSQALAVSPDARPESRLENLILQRRARWLLAKKSDLFLLP